MVTDRSRESRPLVDALFLQWWHIFLLANHYVTYTESRARTRDFIGMGDKILSEWHFSRFRCFREEFLGIILDLW